MQNRRRMICLCVAHAVLLVMLMPASPSQAAMSVLLHEVPHISVESTPSADRLTTTAIQPYLHAASPMVTNSSLPGWVTLAQLSKIKIVPVPTAALMGVAMLIGLGFARRFRRK